MNGATIGKLGDNRAFGWAATRQRRARGAPMVDGAVLNDAMRRIWPTAIKERSVNGIRFSRLEYGFPIPMVNECFFAREEPRADPNSRRSQSESGGKTPPIGNATCGNNGDR